MSVSLPSTIHKPLSATSGQQKAPYCYDTFVLLGRWSKKIPLFNYLLYFFFLLTTVVPMAAPPLTNSRAIHKSKIACIAGLRTLIGCSRLGAGWLFSQELQSHPRYPFAILSTSDCSVIFFYHGQQLSRQLPHRRNPCSCPYSGHLLWQWLHQPLLVHILVLQGSNGIFNSFFIASTSDCSALLLFRSTASIAAVTSE